MQNLSPTPQHLQPLIEEIERLFDGSFQKAADKVDEVMYMLFYVSPDEFSHQQIQTTAYQLHCIREALKKCSNLPAKS